MEKTQFLFAKVKDINEQDRTLEAIASTRDLDRHGDVVLPSAFAEKIESFKANPVILATHQHRLSSGSSPVIGSAEPESIRISDNDVTFTMRFAETALGEEYWQLYKGKHMRAFSIGFIPLEWTDEKDEQVGYIRTYTKIELLEISAVPVPSNRRALVRAKGYFEAEEKNNLLQAILDTWEEEIKRLGEAYNTLKNAMANDFERVHEEFDEIKSLLIADRDGLAERLLGADSELTDDSGDTDTTGQQVKRIRKVFQSGG